jgi:hypothetical protein
LVSAARDFTSEQTEMKNRNQQEIAEISEKEFSAASVTSLGPSKPVGEVGCSSSENQFARR